MSPVVVNILDLIDMGGSEVIEHKLATFSSPKNPEIEDFIRKKAISFATGKLSITYLVNDGDIHLSNHPSSVSFAATFSRRAKAVGMYIPLLLS